MYVLSTRIVGVCTCVTTSGAPKLFLHMHMHMHVQRLSCMCNVVIRSLWIRSRKKLLAMLSSRFFLTCVECGRERLDASAHVEVRRVDAHESIVGCDCNISIPGRAQEGKATAAVSREVRTRVCRSMLATPKKATRWSNGQTNHGQTNRVPGMLHVEIYLRRCVPVRRVFSVCTTVNKCSLQ